MFVLFPASAGAQIVASGFHARESRRNPRYFNQHAGAAGFIKGALYSSFESREAMLLELLQSCTRNNALRCAGSKRRRARMASRAPPGGRRFSKVVSLPSAFRLQRITLPTFCRRRCQAPGLMIPFCC